MCIRDRFILAILIYSNSSLLIELLAPNLSSEAKSIAAYQLQILTPCIPLSGFIGLSFGALNSQRKFFLSSISPAITSLTTIFFILFSWISTKRIHLLISLLTQDY